MTLALRPLLLSIVLVAALAAARAGSTAAPARWKSCRAPRSDVHRLQVSHLTCGRASRALRRGTFELTPGGPLFTTPGYRCRSPVGPPTDGPRFTVCGHCPRVFRFYSFAEL